MAISKTKSEKQNLIFGIVLLLAFPLVIGLVTWMEDKKAQAEEEGDR